MKTNLRTIPGASQGKEDADTARAWIEVLNTVVDEAPIDELSDEEVEAELTERGIKTPRGGDTWNQVTVMRRLGGRDRGQSRQKSLKRAGLNAV